jgi:hypothetical protein
VVKCTIIICSYMYLETAACHAAISKLSRARARARHIPAGILGSNIRAGSVPPPGRQYAGFNLGRTAIGTLRKFVFSMSCWIICS